MALKIACFANHSFVFLDNRELFAFGKNTFGVMGIGGHLERECSWRPFQVR